MLVFIWLSLLTRSVYARRSVEFYGAGASLPAEVYSQWLSTYTFYRQSYIKLTTAYQSTGSGDGIRRIEGLDSTQPFIHYAGSDIVLRQEDYDKHPTLQMFPTMAGALVLAYNLPGVPKLVLSREAIVGLYNGTVRWWNDSLLAGLNPGVALPGVRVAVIARLDQSGTTEVFTAALSSFSPTWRSVYGTFNLGLNVTTGSPLMWNDSVVSYYGYTNRGMAALVQSILFSIAYLSLADATTEHMPFAHVINRRGHTVVPTYASAEAAMLAAQLDPRMNAVLLDSADPDAYPLLAYTYFIVPMQVTTSDCSSYVELLRYFLWTVESDDASSSCEDLSMAPLPNRVAAIVREGVLKRMSCNGALLYGLLQQAMADEGAGGDETHVTVIVITVSAAVLITGLIAGFWAYSRVYVINRAALRNEHLVAFTEIYTDESQSHSKATSRTSVSSDVSTTDTDGGVVSQHGTWRERSVSLLVSASVRPSTFAFASKKWFTAMRDRCSHANVLRVYGVTMDTVDGVAFWLTERVRTRTLADILLNERYRLDENFKFSIAIDVARGLEYLHGYGVGHLRLSSANCFIDDRWVVKIGDWVVESILAMSDDRRSPLARLKAVDQTADLGPEVPWLAPELLVEHPPWPLSVEELKAADVYSFGLLLHQVFTRESLFSDELVDVSVATLIERIVRDGVHPKLHHGIPRRIRDLLEACWKKGRLRPHMSKVVKQLNALTPSRKPLIDLMLKSLEEYTEELENSVELATQQLEGLTERHNALLSRWLPAEFVLRISRGENVPPQLHERSTVCIMSVVDFGSIMQCFGALAVCGLLNSLVTKLDAIAQQHACRRTDSVSHLFIFAAGMSFPDHRVEHEDGHAFDAADLALDAVDETRELSQSLHAKGMSLRLRVGLHSGPVYSCIVGESSPRLSVLGETVQLCRSLEAASEPQCVHISEATNDLLAQSRFETVERGLTQIKGQAVMRTFWLTKGRSMREAQRTAGDDDGTNPLPWSVPTS